jgi:CheY-like chemotaxis protein
MRMPVLDGWEFTRAYRQRPGPHAPIVVLTATRDAHAWGNEVDADAVLGKPFELTDLLAMLSRFTACVPPPEPS